jgi:hypothetical protein
MREYNTGTSSVTTLCKFGILALSQCPHVPCPRVPKTRRNARMERLGDAA